MSNLRSSEKSKAGVDKMSHTKQNSNPVVRVNQDSDDNLQALFDSVLNPSDLRRPLQVPFRMRKLPNSFFTPPINTSHSRANSTESAYEIDINKQTNNELPADVMDKKPSMISNPLSHNRLTIYHSRAHSSPASLQENYCIENRNLHGTSIPQFVNSAAATTTTQTEGHAMDIDNVNQSGCVKIGTVNAFHMKQRSYDVVSPIQLQNELGPLPPGWEQAKTNDGQIYYLNHTTKTTQWEDPRISCRLQQTRSLSETVILNEISMTSKSSDATTMIDNMGPLPQGWEQAVTESGDIYFINHMDRSTSWNDPRIRPTLDCPDNLVSTLQLEDNICDEIFPDVDTLLSTPISKPENLEWYKIN